MVDKIAFEWFCTLKYNHLKYVQRDAGCKKTGSSFGQDLADFEGLKVVGTDKHSLVEYQLFDSPATSLRLLTVWDIGREMNTVEDQRERE